MRATNCLRLLALTSIFSVPAHANPTYVDEKVVMYGELVPGTTYRYTNVFPGDISDVRDVAFWARFDSFSALNEGIFVSTAGVHRSIAREGDPAPGFPGKTFETFDLHPKISATGDVLFFGSVRIGPNSDDLAGAYYLQSEGVTTMVLRFGDPSPIGGTYSGISFSSMNSSGQYVFRSSITGGSAAEGIFVGSGATHQPIVLAGEPAPGTGGGTYSSFEFAQTPAFNDAGDVAFIAGIAGGAVPQGIFVVEGGGQHRAVALVGDPAPGTGGGAYAQFDPFPYWTEAELAINDDGGVAFGALVSGGTVPHGIFLRSGTTHRAVALPGDPAPGTGGVYSFPDNLWLRFKGLSDTGAVTFEADVSGGSTYEGIFVDDAGSDSAVALPDDPAPHVSGGSYNGTHLTATNAAGDAAFKTWVSSSDISVSEGYGIFFAPEPGALEQLATGFALLAVLTARHRRRVRPPN